jgi:hypothetical protein
MNKNILASNYKMILLLDDRTDLTTLPSAEIILAYNLYTENN